MPEQGKKVPVVQTETGSLKTMNIKVGPVHKALFCIADACDKNHRVVFDNGANYILDKSSGEVIPMRRKGKTYTFTVEVIKPSTLATPGESSGRDPAPSAGSVKALAPLSADFPRQAK